MKLFLVLAAVAAALHAAWSAVGWPAVPFLTGLEYIPEQMGSPPSHLLVGSEFPES